MRKASLFLIVTIASIVSLIAVVAAAYFVLTTPSTVLANQWDNMWSGMMGGGMMNGYGDNIQTQNATGPYFGVAFVILIAVAVVGIGGVIYFALFPEIRNAQITGGIVKTSGSRISVNSQTSEVAGSPYDSVVKTLTPDERKVIDVLSAHNGKYLQKYIRNEAGLSRLQTHRIVARLAERGIVTLEKTGNTNTVLLSDWLK